HCLEIVRDEDVGGRSAFDLLCERRTCAIGDHDAAAVLEQEEIVGIDERFFDALIGKYANVGKLRVRWLTNRPERERCDEQDAHAENAKRNTTYQRLSGACHLSSSPSIGRGARVGAHDRRRRTIACFDCIRTSELEDSDRGPSPPYQRRTRGGAGI